MAAKKPIYTYNIATTSPPMNWLLDPAPANRFCINAESIAVASNQCSRPPNGFIMLRRTMPHRILLLIAVTAAWPALAEQVTKPVT